MRQFIAVTLLLVAGAPLPAERVVDGDGLLDATLNGVPVRVRVNPAGTAMPVFDEATATRAGLKKSFFGVAFRVGAVKLSGFSDVATLALGGPTFKRRVAWTTRRFDARVDGSIGPGGLPEPVVRFLLGPARAGERTLILPMGGGHWDVARATATLNGTAFSITFDPHAPRTVATAAAGVALAATYRGVVSGEPLPLPIAFGVSRPVRELTFADPVQLGPLTVRALAVRVADGGAVGALREADADPDEVQVVGKGKRGRAGLLIGADLLRRCSSLVFDRRAGQIRLTCA